MKTKAAFRVVGVRQDGELVLIMKHSTPQGAELVRRLIQHASPYAELRIEGGPESDVATRQVIAVDETSR